MKKAPYVKVKQLRMIGIAVLVVLAAILVPILQNRCAAAPPPEAELKTAYYASALLRCLEAQDFENREGTLRDSRLERRLGSISWGQGERELDRIEFRIPYLLVESGKAETEEEFLLLQRSNETRESIGRVIIALYHFADVRENTLTPQPEQLFSQVLDAMRGGKKTAWVWAGLYCTVEQHMDMLGNTTLAITAQRMAAWDTPAPTG